MEEYTMLNSMLAKGIALASAAHGEQKRWNGTPYILHPLRVMATFLEIREIYPDAEHLKCAIAGVLHDVIEDTDLTCESLENEGFTPEIINAVKLLTRNSKQDYQEYLAALKGNYIARKVKIADLLDNMNPIAVPELNERFYLKLEKYRRSLDFLSADR